MTLLSATGLSRIYKDTPEGQVEVFKGLDISIEKHQTVSIMGPSGCGKSSLISILAGLEKPEQGQVQILKQSLYGLSEEERTRFRAQHIGIIFQQFHLLPHLSALENARLPLDFSKATQANKKATQALESVGLIHRLNHFPHQLSRGECQRVAIARVLVSDPDLILADEPTGSLDQDHAEEVMNLLIERLEERGTSLLLVTHDPQMAIKCTRQIRFDRGRLLEAGDLS